MTNYIVLRNCPPSLADHEGWWYDLADLPAIFPAGMGTNWLGADFYPTGRFEGRITDSERAE